MVVCMRKEERFEQLSLSSPGGEVGFYERAGQIASEIQFRAHFNTKTA